MKKIFFLLSSVLIFSENSHGMQNLLRAGSEKFLPHSAYRCFHPQKRFFSGTLGNDEIPVSKEDINLPLERKKFINDLMKSDQKVVRNQVVKEKNWEKNLQEGWSDFNEAAKEDLNLSSEKFFDDIMKSDQATKKEDRLEVIRCLSKKMVIKGMDPKDISEITGLSEAEILNLKIKE